MRSCQKLLPCLAEPMPAGSKRHPLLAKAQHISDGGSATGIMYLRRRRKITGWLQLGERSEISERNSTADPIMSERRKRCFRCWDRYSLATCGEDCGEVAAPLQLVENLCSGSAEKHDLQNPCAKILSSLVPELLKFLTAKTSFSPHLYFPVSAEIVLSRE